MKKSVFIICIVVAISFFFSCASDPSVIIDVPDLPEISSEVIIEQPTEELPQPEITETVEETPDIVLSPSIPDDDRLLYFYPEPETFLALPEVSSSSESNLEPDIIDDSEVLPEVVQVIPAPPVSVIPPTEAEVASKARITKTPEISIQPEKKAEQILPSTVLPDKEISGIWETEPVAPAHSHLRSASGIVPSRSVSVYSNQTLEVWYPGSGWVYLGDASSRNGLSYQSRKLDGQDTLFSFKAQTPGDYILEFSRFDVLSDAFSSDALAVTVLEPDSSRIGKVRSPNFTFSPIIPAPSKADIKQEGFDAPSKESIPLDEPVLRSIPEQLESIPEKKQEDPSVMLKEVQTALSKGEIDSAMSLLDSFFSLAITDLDEGWFLRGQAYEANSPKRDIRKALNAYETLVSAYPDSERWQEADSRIRYIRQFYLRIR